MSYHDYGRFSRRHQADVRPWYEEDQFDRGASLRAAERYRPVVEFSTSPRRDVDYGSLGYSSRYSAGSHYRSGGDQQPSYRQREYSRDDDPLNNSLDSLRFRLPPEEYYRRREPVSSMDRDYDDSEFPFEPHTSRHSDRTSRYPSRTPYHYDEEPFDPRPTSNRELLDRRVSHTQSQSVENFRHQERRPSTENAPSATKKSKVVFFDQQQETTTSAKAPKLQLEVSTQSCTASHKRTNQAPKLKLDQPTSDKRKARLKSLPPSKSTAQLQSEMISGTVRESGTRILTVSINQIRQISRLIDRIRPKISVVYELHGRIGSIFNNGRPRLQLCSRFQITDLTNQNNCLLDCVFYDIDDTDMMRNLHEGLACQCVGRFRSDQNEFQCLSVRPLFENEMKLVKLLRMLTQDALNEMLSPQNAMGMKREE